MITTNTGAKKIEGTDNWREIFDAHNDSVDAHDKVSEAMTYVVNGNKSIENAAIPVGSYVRLANSKIVGRSDGIYTVKTAIPVNTVIDSSYFNESAPIAGGVANALNSKIVQYSTDEKIVGSFDGHDIYEKTYYLRNQAKAHVLVLDSRNIFIDSSSSFIYCLVSAEGCAVTESGSWLPIGMITASYGIGIQTASQGLSIVGTGYNLTGCFVTVRYMKT